MTRNSLIILGMLLLAGCETVPYYTQAVHGQFSILTHRRSIEKVVEDPRTEETLRSQLESVLEIREFAQTRLQLPVEDNFSTYVDLEQPFVVWNVFAAPEFSLNARQWCYPIAGCVTYRGYFSDSQARRYAQGLKEEGLDVYVGGVAAYSTLGWFSDPVLNTIVSREEHRLASLLFHELAHQLVYVPGDTEFNESFATAVELEGLRRWLEASGDASEAAEIVQQATQEKVWRQEFVGLVQATIAELDTLYKSDQPDNLKREDKSRLIEELRVRYQEARAGWNGYDAYDNWFSTTINNAKLRTVSTYFNLVPAFDALLEDVEFDLPEFYAQVELLGRLPRKERRAALAALTP